MILVIGTGPGSKEYLTPIAWEKAKEADVLIGGKRALELFQSLEKETIEINSDLEEIIEYISKNHNQKKIAVLVTGDPGLFSLLGLISKHHTGNELEVIPGVSSMQLCFARLAKQWDDAKFITLHGRNDQNILQEVLLNKKVCVFTDSVFPPNKIADFLLEQGVKAKAVVCEDLSHPDERITEANIEELSRMSGFKRCILYLERGD